MELRDYQKECVNIINNLKKGSYLVSMATGLGKTVVFSALNRKGRVLIISHREELVTQPIKYFNCPCGIEQGENTSHGEEVISASVQSLIRRLDKFKPDEFDTIITDEAHHAAAPSYKKIYAYFTPRLHLGFTATPNRGDKVRLDDVFDQIIFQRDLKWGIYNNYLTDIRCFRAKISCDLRPVRVQMGDFQVGSLERAINTDRVNKEISKIYQNYARGQTLIFATSVAHAKAIAQNIPGAVAVTQKTLERSQIIKDFTARKINCLVNCMIFTEGTDIPLIETIIIARPTKNQSLYAQMVGRGLRKFQNKPYLTLIDLVGVTENLDICTAPSLLGLDLKEIPQKRLDNIQGMLTDMPDIVDKAYDCPENWIVNLHTVQLFAKEQGVNTHSINWTKKPNGDLVYQFACGDRIGIKAINELGKTKIMYYLFDDGLQKFVYRETEETTLQQALTEAYGFFSTYHNEEKPLWSVDNYFVWQQTPATEKQISYIKSKLSPEDFEAVYNNGRIRKGDCSQIINMLQIKNATKKDLLRMHSLAEKKQQEASKRIEQMSKLKIETFFDTKFKNKFYAIKHPTRLVICDTWEKALEVIMELNSLDDQACVYKKFPSKSQAINFLRKF